MFGSDRLRTPHADDHDETDLWERLRSEANRRGGAAPGTSTEPPSARFDDHGDREAMFDSDLPDAYTSDSDLPPPPDDSSHPDETSRRVVQTSRPPLRQSYAHARPDYSEASQLAQYEAQHARQQEDECDEHDDESYEQEEYEAQQFAHEQYDLQRFSQPPPAPPLAQMMQTYGTKPVRTTLSQTGQHYASLPPAAYGHVTSSNSAQQRSYTATSSRVTAAETGKSSRWTKPLIALASVLALGAGVYQFVLVPRSEDERAEELVALQQQQEALIAQQEQEAEAAAALAEAEQRAANEAALRRADQAAAAAGQPPATPTAGHPVSADTTASAVSASDGTAVDAHERRRQERHARRAAAKAGKGETSSHRRSRRKIYTSAGEESNDDPLLGL